MFPSRAFLFFLAHFVAHRPSSSAQLDQVMRWKKLEYDLVDTEGGKMANGYDQTKNVLGSVRKYKGDLYISVPRWRDG